MKLWTKWMAALAIGAAFIVVPAAQASTAKPTAGTISSTTHVKKGKGHKKHSNKKKTATKHSKKTTPHTKGSKGGKGNGKRHHQLHSA